VTPASPNPILAPLAAQLPKLKPEDRVTLTKEYLAKKLPQWEKLSADDQGKLVNEVVTKYQGAPDPPGTSIPGSVFDRPTLGQRLLRGAKAVAPAVAGMAVPIAAGLATDGLSVPAQVAVQGAAGAVSPYVEAGVAKVMGEHPEAPSLKQVVSSAAFNAGASLAAPALRALGAGKGAEVADQISELPPEAQTPANIKQAMRNRDFWKQMGLNDQQIDDAIHNTALQSHVAQSIKAGEDARGAFQKIVDTTRESFHNRYDAVIGKFAKVHATPAETADLRKTIADQLEVLAQRSGDITSNAKMYSGIPLQSVEKLGGMEWSPSVERLRDIRTQLRVMRQAAGANNALKAGLNQIEEQIDATLDKTLERAGATPEEIAARHAIDADYGRFMDTLDTLDPRSEKFGENVNKALWGAMGKNPDNAAHLIEMAQAAEQAHPGQVMPQLRESFLQHALESSRIEAQGRPVEEMKALQKLQQQWGGSKGLRVVLNTMFPDSPLKNPTTLAQVLGALGNADATAAKVAKGVNPFGVPSWLLRLGTAYALYSGLTGSLKSPWSDMHQDPVRFLAGMTAMYLTLGTAAKIYSSGDMALQRAYTKFLTNPDLDTFKKVATVIGAGGGAVAGSPATEPALKP
jgi:hypothetical protein